MNRTLQQNELPQISYEFSTDLPGRADGTISVTNLGSIGQNFSLLWGTSKKILSKKGTTFVTGERMVGTTTLKYTLRPFSCIPAGVTHLWLCSDGNLITSYEIPKERRLKKEAPLYRFGVISDLHIGRGNGKLNTEMAMKFLKRKKASFVISAGDNTNNGKENHWREFAECVHSYEIPFWFVLGNHDALAWNLRVTPEEAMAFCKQLFPDYVNENHSYGKEFDVTVSDVNPDYDYSFTYNGDLFLFMGVGAASNFHKDVNIDQRLSQSQINWLDKMLSDHFNNPNHGKVFFTCHYATNESGLFLAGLDAESSAMLHDVLNRYPGVISFTGHVHWGFESEKSIYIADYAIFQLPCVLADSYGFLVEVYKDYIIIQGFHSLRGAMDFVTYLVPNDFAD